jgi:hypothetical protein
MLTKQCCPLLRRTAAREKEKLLAMQDEDYEQKEVFDSNCITYARYGRAVMCAAPCCAALPALGCSCRSCWLEPTIAAQRGWMQQPRRLPFSSPRPRLTWHDVACDTWRVIRPGTPFMVRLSKNLKFFIAKKIAEDAAWQVPDIIFSGHEVPGACG